VRLTSVNYLKQEHGLLSGTLAILNIQSSHGSVSTHFRWGWSLLLHTPESFIGSPLV